MVRWIGSLNNFKEKGFKKVVIKSQIGASGCGMIVHKTDNSNNWNFPEYLFFEGPCLVQGWIDKDDSSIKQLGSPSVQMFLSETGVSIFDITEQFLNENSIHQGNISPPTFFGEKKTEIIKELLDQASEAGRWLMRNFSFNPPIKSKHLLSELNRVNLLYNKNREKGVLPFNFNNNKKGLVNKGQFVFLAKEPEECINLLKEMETLFLTTCSFDRD